MRRCLEILLLLIAPLVLVVFALAGGGIGDAAWLGMKVSALHKSEAARLRIPANAGQVVVVAVDGPALSSGVIVGDLVLGINSQNVGSVNEFLKAARSVMTARGADGRLPDVVLTLNRLGQSVVVTVPSEWVEASIRDAYLGLGK
jgi:S1-C subfamily serine protease